MPRPPKDLPTLPVERAVKVIAGRWKVLLLYHLYAGPRRLTELARLLRGLHEKVLIQQLRELELHGLVARETHPQVPPRVDYRATELGLSLRPIIGALCEWGHRHAEALQEADRLEACDAPSSTLP